MHKIFEHLVGTSDLNTYGNLYGGKLLSILDDAGWELVIKRLKPRGQVVTKKVSEVNFRAPIQLGETIEIYGDITNIGTSSATVELSVMLEGRRAITSTFIYVHIKEGKPYPIISI